MEAIEIEQNSISGLGDIEGNVITTNKVLAVLLNVIMVTRRTCENFAELICCKTEENKYF